MSKDFEAAIKNLTLEQRGELKKHAKNQFLSYIPKDLVLKLVTNTLEELGLSLLPLAASFSITPVSNFHVGAVAFDSAGNAYLGANFELADTHIGQTIHAEQSAIANAWSRGAEDLALLVISYAPCGYCRQFIKEVNLSDHFVIQLPNQAPQALVELLPDAFGPEDLSIQQCILKKRAQTSTDNDDEKDEVINAAKTAYARSHAPYSGSQFGIALIYPEGEIITGYYGENAAFNPSLPALQMALNMRRFNHGDFKDIKRAVMVETPTTINQRENTEQLLKTLCDVELEYHLLR